MKKKLVIIIIGLFILIPVISNWYGEFTTPDKVLAVGHSIDGEAIEFKKEIEDQEKIVKYENVLKSLEFTKTEWEPSQYPDYILKVDHLVEGIATSFINMYLKEGAKILDIGAGTGAYSIYYADRGYDVTAIEPVKRNVDIIKSKVNTEKMRIDIQQGNALNMANYADDSFNC